MWHYLQIKNRYNFVLGACVLLGICLRLYKIGYLPDGLQGDEVSAGFEAFSILNTGADRWGLRLPPYFLSWGSGQNTLIGYLSIPALAVFGVSDFSIRITTALLSLLSLIFAYKIIMRLYGQHTLALATVVLYIFSPYLFISARWANDFCIIPFFVLAHLYTHIVWVQSASKAGSALKFSEKISILMALPLAAIIFYAYASSLFMFPVFYALFLWNYGSSLIKHKLFVTGSLVLGVMVFAPFGLFILKNNILHKPLAIEPYLPFDLPLMLSAREELWRGWSENLATIGRNHLLLINGFVDNWVYNRTEFKNPQLLIPFVLPGLLAAYLKHRAKITDALAVVLYLFVGYYMIFLLVHVNDNRSHQMQSIIPLLVAIGIFEIYQSLVNHHKIKRLFLGAVAMVFLLQTVGFLAEYFLRYPSYDPFPKGIAKAIKLAEQQRKPEEKIAYSQHIIFNYLYAALYTQFSPKDFQQKLWADRTESTVRVLGFGHHAMLGDKSNYGHEWNTEVIDSLKKQQSFVAVLLDNERIEALSDGFVQEKIGQNLQNYAVYRYSRKEEAHE